MQINLNETPLDAEHADFWFVVRRGPGHTARVCAFTIPTKPLHVPFNEALSGCLAEMASKPDLPAVIGLVFTRPQLEASHPEVAAQMPWATDDAAACFRITADESWLDALDAQVAADGVPMQVLGVFPGDFRPEDPARVVN